MIHGNIRHLTSTLCGSLYGGNKINKYGAIAGIVTGGLTSALWPLANTTLLPLIPGFITGFFTLYIISYYKK